MSILDLVYHCHLQSDRNLRGKCRICWKFWQRFLLMLENAIFQKKKLLRLWSHLDLIRSGKAGDSKFTNIMPPSKFANPTFLPFKIRILTIFDVFPITDRRSRFLIVAAKKVMNCSFENGSSRPRLDSNSSVLVWEADSPIQKHVSRCRFLSHNRSIDPLRWLSPKARPSLLNHVWQEWNVLNY